MKVSDVLKRLATGHLSNLSMSQETGQPGIIRITDQPKIIGYMNDALTQIYSRFVLYQREVIIVQQATITQYHLDKRFAMYNPDRPAGNVPYILDLPAEPFGDDAIKILSVSDQYGNNITLNDDDLPNSIFTPFPTTLQIPFPVDQAPLSIIYQAKHLYLDPSVITSEVSIPLVLLPAFLALVSGSQYRDMNTQEMQAVAGVHLQFYETECARIEEKSNASIQAHSSQVDKFIIRGFC